MSFRKTSAILAATWLICGVVSCGKDKDKADPATPNGDSGAPAEATGGSGSAGKAGHSTAGSSDTTTAQGGAGDASAGNAACPAAALLRSLGKDKLLIGGSMADATAKLAPFDLRYLYLSGAFPDGDKPCTSCASGCATSGTTCANSGPGCQWWGCWQFDQDPPGAYLRNFIETAKADGQIPMISLYMILQASKVKEGPAEITAANDPAVMLRYYDQFRFLLKQIGDDVALLHLEPDLWGYAEQINTDPTKIPAAVASANPEDCQGLPNTIAGFGSCLVAMAHSYAPKTKVGLHASAWGTSVDVFINKDASVDAGAVGTKTGEFLGVAGADADFIVVDAADRDAAWYATQNQQRAWDATNETLPNFTQAFTWANALALAAKKPVFWWQTPLGNESLPNVDGQWKDNRLDYFLDHLDELAASQAFGVAFGAGAGGQTTFESDGGHAVAKVKEALANGSQAPCP